MSYYNTTLILSLINDLIMTKINIIFFFNKSRISSCIIFLNSKSNRSRDRASRGFTKTMKRGKYNFIILYYTYTIILSTKMPNPSEWKIACKCKALKQKLNVIVNVLYFWCVYFSISKNFRIGCTDCVALKAKTEWMSVALTCTYKFNIA